MNFLIKNCKELTYKGLLAVNGGCSGSCSGSSSVSVNYPTGYVISAPTSNASHGTSPGYNYDPRPVPPMPVCPGGSSLYIVRDCNGIIIKGKSIL